MAEKYAKIKRIRVNGVDFDVDFEPIGYIVSPNGINYTLAVDDDGNLFTIDKDKIPAPETQPTTSGATMSKLYINSFYCGGKNADEHTLNYCSHNFVELSNLTTKDINLSGFTLQYAISATDWKSLPLQGVIKAGSTFVVRGAQCSMLNSPTTKIIVDKYDQEWYIDNNELIKFDSEVSAKFYLALNSNTYTSTNPYNPSASGVSADAIGYVDLVGVNGSGNPGGFEGSPYSNGGGLSNTRLFKKYYSMDPVKQATKAIDARSNANDWCFIDLTKDDGEVIPCIEVYRPMASWEGKDTFYDKTKLLEHKPSMISCSFGIQATDAGNGATRCFNWLTKDPHNKYIWIRANGSSDWGVANESFHEGDGRTLYTNAVYNRVAKEYTGNVVIIVNKYIQSGFTAGTYEYIAGSKNADGTPKLDECTEIRKFTVRTNEQVANGFTFLQTTDQQGFNWPEYRVWEASAKSMTQESGSTYDFMINTGDMTQNGNRLGEWLDYFNGKTEGMNNMEEMATIGNNDLSLNVLYMMGNGNDDNKLWHENITFFFTFEIDEENPPIFEVDGINYYIPSLYSFNYGKVHFLSVNSEIKPATETSTLGYGFSTYGNFYPQIWQWCERDHAKYCNATTWNIGFCHEMPFTILTPDVTETTGAMITDRCQNAKTGSNTNYNTPQDKQYWLSEFFQKHDYKLVIGGHKHTQATSWPIMENVKYDGDARTVDSMHPIIVLSSASTSEFYIGKYFCQGHESDSGATSLVAYNGYKYPNTWFDGGTLKSGYKNPAAMCTFEMEENLTNEKPVLYAMSQATSYKHTSNKELPGQNIPWLRYYFPRASYDAAKNKATADAEQKFPFYTIWNITDSTITGNVRKTYGVFNSKGKFDVNVDGYWVRQGKSAADTAHGPIHSINGITTMTVAQAETDTRKIIIEK